MTMTQTIVYGIHLREPSEGVHMIKGLRKFPYNMKAEIIRQINAKNMVFYAYINLSKYNLPHDYILHGLQLIAGDVYSQYFTKLANMYNLYLIIYHRQTKCITVWADNDDQIENLINYLKICFTEQKDLYKRKLSGSDNLRL